MPQEAQKVEAREGKQKPSWCARLVLIALGLGVGLGTSELGVYVYQEWSGWGRFDSPPPYRADADHIRLAVLGGSTSKGSPYNGALRMTSFGRDFTLLSTTEFFLSRRYGYANVEVDLYANGGWTAYKALEYYWTTATYKPDAIVLYTGHNERSSYYSANMTPPPRFLSAFTWLKTGRLLSRYLFEKQADPEDSRYRGEFFSDNIVPSYEQEFNLRRYRRCVEQIARHCAKENIGLILIIPEANYLFPPNRSVYDGPADKKAHALRLFKKAFYYKYFEKDPGRALEMLTELLSFCSFADLYYELGDIYYHRGDFEKARSYLLKALETDALPDRLAPKYKVVLREVAAEYGAPCIDMNEVMTRKLGVVLPDYTCYVDCVHFRPRVYEALGGEIIHALRRTKHPRLALPEKVLAIGRQERHEYLGLTDKVVAHAQMGAATWTEDETEGTFLKLRRYQQALAQYQAVRAMGGAPGVDERIANLKDKIRLQKKWLLKWLRDDNDLPEPTGTREAVLR